MNRTPTPTLAVVVAVAVLTLAVWPGVADGSNTQKDALLALWHATDGHSWKSNSGWVTYLVHPNPCGDSKTPPWYGVYCSSGNVVLLTLPDNNLAGTIPDELSGLTALVNLDLRSNKLTGTVPASLFSLLQLQTLLINNNQLSGPLPAGFAGVSGLVSVDLSANALQGPLVPISCPTLCSLKELNLSGNKLTSTVPDMFGALPFLQLLDLSSNNLYGPIPPSLPRISQLGTVNLANNSLSGSIPDAFASASQLSSLVMASNKFTGPVPDLSKLQDLHVFDAADNGLNGTVPAWAGCDRSLVCRLGGNPGLLCPSSCSGNNCEVMACSSCVLPSCASSTQCIDAGGPCRLCDPETHRCVVPLAPPPPSPGSAPPSPPSPPPPVLPITSTFTGASTTTGPSNATYAPSPPPAYGAIIGITFAIVCCIGSVVAVAVVRVRRASAQEAAERAALLGAGRRHGRHGYAVNSDAGYYFDDSCSECGPVSGESSGSFRTAKDRTKELSVRFDTGASGKRGETFTFVIDTRLEIIKWSELEITGEIGRGGYGTVLRARRGHTDVAVKVLRDIVHPEQVQAFVEEASILSDLKHPNCVLLMGVCVEPHHMSIVTEYMRGGDLHDLVYPHDDSLVPLSASASLLTRRRRFQILYQVALGLEYLHARGIAHRDIKLRNILLDDRSPQTAKLADFGLAGLKKMDIGGGGTEMYSAPEVLQGSTADKRSDMFSFGIVLFEVLYSHKPSSRIPGAEAAPGSAATSAPIPIDGLSVDIPDDCPLELATLLRACLSQNPSARPPISRITGVLEELAAQNIFSVGPVNTTRGPAASFDALPTDSPSRHKIALPPLHPSSSADDPQLPPPSQSSSRPPPPDLGW